MTMTTTYETARETARHLGAVAKLLTLQAIAALALVANNSSANRCTDSPSTYAADLAAANAAHIAAANAHREAAAAYASISAVAVTYHTQQANGHVDMVRQ